MVEQQRLEDAVEKDSVIDPDLVKPRKSETGGCNFEVDIAVSFWRSEAGPWDYLVLKCIPAPDRPRKPLFSIPLMIINSAGNLCWAITEHIGFHNGWSNFVGCSLQHDGFADHRSRSVMGPSLGVCAMSGRCV